MLALLSVVVFACDDSKTSQTMDAGPYRISETDQSILGFEDFNDWFGSNANSTVHSEGTHSLVVQVNGWTELVSANLSSIGPVGEQISLDIQMPAETPDWGEVVLMAEMPSQGLYRREIGRVGTSGRSAGIFETFTFSLPADVQAKINGSYSDLTLIVAVNAPAGTYLLDNLSFTEGQMPDTDSTDDVHLKVFVRYEGTHETNILKPRIYLQNVGETPIRNFKVYYYFTIEHGQILPASPEDYYTPYCDVYFERLSAIEYRVVYDYNGYILPAGGIVPNTSGNAIGIHYADWSTWNKDDDPSYDGPNVNFEETTSIVVVGENEELLHGQIPLTGRRYKTHHGMDENTLNDMDKKYRPDYSMSYIDAYADENGVPRFAAIWTQTGSVPTTYATGMTSDEYQAMFDHWEGEEGYRLVSVDGYNVGSSEPLFAAVFHKVTGSSWTSFHNRSITQLREAEETQRNVYGRVPTAINGYVNSSGESLYAVIFEQTNRPVPEVIFDYSHEDYQNTYTDMASDGYTITHLDVHANGTDTVFASIWERRFEPRRAVHGRSHEHYQIIFDNMMYSGHRLEKVTGYLEDGQVKYGAFWKPVYLSAEDTRYIADNIKAKMVEYHVPAASVAISHHGKLVYAQGFGIADTGGTPAGPYHRMRIASISKSITAAAIMKLIQDYPDEFEGTDMESRLNTPIFGDNGILGHNYGTIDADNSYLATITLNHLLEHRLGSWGSRNQINEGLQIDPGIDLKSKGNYTARWEDIPAVIQNTVEHTVNDTDGVGPADQWVMPEPDMSDVFSYSNYGYMILGEVIAHITGKRYEEYVNDEIFAPLGITKTALSEYTWVMDPANPDADGWQNAALLSMEVEYPQGGPSDTDHPAGDDGRNIRRMAAHGGWVAPAMDLVRFEWQQSGEFGSIQPDGTYDPYATNLYGLKNETADEYRTMRAPSGHDYAKGVNIEGLGGSTTDAYRWWHSGSLDATISQFWCQNSDSTNNDPEYNGFCVAVILNNSHILNPNDDPKDPDDNLLKIPSDEFRNVLLDAIQHIGYWPDVDHFYGSN
ncbi:MAG: serine hydrolase [Deltaproteobacteria bacterium]|nr:serine hydrolase [Deltaproteobacteria bacterium]